MADTVREPNEGKTLIRFNQCQCGMKEFCRMFGKHYSCDEVVPDYPAESIAGSVR